MEFNFPRSFAFKSYAIYSLHYMEWYLNQKIITDDINLFEGDNYIYQAKWLTLGDTPSNIT